MKSIVIDKYALQNQFNDIQINNGNRKTTHWNKEEEVKFFEMYAILKPSTLYVYTV